MGRLLLDYGLATALLPVLVVCCVIVKVANALTGDFGPLFYRDPRYGRDRCEIRVWKFRTLRGNDKSVVVRNDCRVTPVGRIIRAYRIDELPQILNVLAGQMHIVGPRPLCIAHTTEQSELLYEKFAERFTVKPGITGWAHVSRRFDTERPEAYADDLRLQLELDAEYVRIRQLRLDLLIVCLTPFVMLARRGVC